MIYILLSRQIIFYFIHCYCFVNVFYMVCDDMCGGQRLTLWHLVTRFMV